MRTIRGTLIVGVVPGLVLLISVLSGALYLYMANVLTAQQDASILSRAHVVSGRVRWSREQPGQMVSPDVNYGEFGRSNHPSCFEIFDPDGNPLVRSELLGSGDLPLPQRGENRPVFLNVKLPNGRPGRAVVLRYVPSNDLSSSLPPQMRRGLTPGKRFTIVLAKDAAPVRNPTLVLLCSLIALVGFMAVGLVVLMSLALRRGLRPLEQIARQAAARSPNDSPELFPTDGMPGELLPICDRLNDLLRRLYDSLQRQRRFATDAAHELRTPIAEIRTLAEVASQWGDLPTARSSLLDVLEVSRKMEAIVSHLLAKARCDFGKLKADLQPIAINPLIEKTFNTFLPRALARNVSFATELIPAARVRSDPALLESILVNLCGNAVEYATAGTKICCTTRSEGEQLRLEIANDAPGLTPQDVPQLFEPFWRKDPSRSDARHCGLGLTLTKAYADVLHVPLSVQLSDAHELRFSLRLPVHSADPHTISSPAEWPDRFTLHTKR